MDRESGRDGNSTLVGQRLRLDPPYAYLLRSVTSHGLTATPDRDPVLPSEVDCGCVMGFQLLSGVGGNDLRTLFGKTFF